jgi:hypothetical protein
MEAFSRSPVTCITRNQNRSTTERDPGCTKITAHIHFVLCEVCYWSATFFNIKKNPVVKCPYCDSIRIDSIPMSHNEVCKFGFDPIRGVTMEFSIRRNKGNDWVHPLTLREEITQHDGCRSTSTSII